MTRVLPRAAVLMVALMGTGCATIATGGGGSQTVSVTSNPPGAMVLVDGQPQGTTPAKVPLSRTSEHRVELQAPGYAPAQLTIARKFNPWLLGNIVLGGIVGVVVDVVTDATFTLSPDEVHVLLQPLSRPLIPPEDVPAAKPAPALPEPVPPLP